MAIMHLLFSNLSQQEKVRQMFAYSDSAIGTVQARGKCIRFVARPVFTVRSC